MRRLARFVSCSFLMSAGNLGLVLSRLSCCYSKQSFSFKCHRNTSGSVVDAFPVNDIAFSRAHHTFVTVGSDGKYCIWDKAKRERVRFQTVSCVPSLRVLQTCSHMWPQAAAAVCMRVEPRRNAAGVRSQLRLEPGALCGTPMLMRRSARHAHSCPLAMCRARLRCRCAPSSACTTRARLARTTLPMRASSSVVH